MVQAESCHAESHDAGPGMMSRFSSESNSSAYEGAALKIYPDGADAVLDSATILPRISHADE